MKRQHSAIEWLAALRPWSFTASALTVITILVYLEWSVGGVDWVNGLWALASMILYHAAGNAWSDWFDYRSGVDTAETYGVDTLTSGRFSAASIRNLSLTLYTTASVLGLGLAFHAGASLLYIGGCGLLLALLYPPLKYKGMGDVVILANYCILPALGCSYVGIGKFDLSVLWVALPLGALVNAILHANNTRDMETDMKAGAHSLAQALGPFGSAILFYAETLLPFMGIAALSALGKLPLCSLIILLILPMAWKNCLLMRQYTVCQNASSIATLDQKAALLQLIFSTLLTLSILTTIWL